jgi:hypothetical protein
MVALVMTNKIQHANQFFHVYAIEVSSRVLRLHIPTKGVNIKVSRSRKKNKKADLIEIFI